MADWLTIALTALAAGGGGLLGGALSRRVKLRLRVIPPREQEIGHAHRFDTMGGDGVWRCGDCSAPRNGERGEG